MYKRQVILLVHPLSHTRNMLIAVVLHAMHAQIVSQLVMLLLQREMCIRDSSRLRDFLTKRYEIRLAKEPFFDAIVPLLHYNSAVSYTHLDVYKRQTHWSMETIPRGHQPQLIPVNSSMRTRFTAEMFVESNARVAELLPS